MIPRKFAGATFRLGGLRIPTRVERQEGKVVRFVTSWEPTPDELATLAAGGSVKLVMLNTFPPVPVLSVEPVAVVEASGQQALALEAAE